MIRALVVLFTLFTITAAVNAQIVTDVVVPSIAPGSISLNGLATQATNTLVGNATSGMASPTALPVGSCSTSSSALSWTTNTGFGCNTSINAATLGGATFAAPGAIGSGTPSAGSFTSGSFSSTLSASLANTATTSAVCYNTGTGLLTYDGTIGTCTVSALAMKDQIDKVSGKIALAGVMSLRTESWTYKKDPQSRGVVDSRVHIGFYADDWEKIDKRCVGYKDGELQDYDNRCALAYLTAAFQEYVRTHP